MSPWCGLFQDYLTCIIHGFLPRIPPKQRQDQQWNWQFFSLLDSIICTHGIVKFMEPEAFSEVLPK